jgi:hypothetical protein
MKKYLVWYLAVMAFISLLYTTAITYETGDVWMSVGFFIGFFVMASLTAAFYLSLMAIPILVAVWLWKKVKSE